MQDFYNAIKTLASGRVFPMVAPAAATYPLIVYSLISAEHVWTLGGASGLQLVQMQVDAYARTMAEALDLQENVKAAVLAAFTTVGEVRTVLTEFDEATRLYRVAVDFTYHR